jgi:hypothetical protein
LLEVSARMPYHTDLHRVFMALDGRQREFNWLLTDLELDHYPPGLPYLADRQLARWMTGAALSAIVEAHDVQFIWGVLSGFRSGVTPDLAPLDPYPFADCNEALWRPGLQIQHPLADVEIVCWDSSATILLSRDDDLTRRFRVYFPEAVDLDEHNRGALGQMS